MRTTRKIVTMIAVLALLFTSVVPAFAAGFPDLEGHWSKTYMEKLVEKGIMNGYKDGTIKPENKVTAAEAFIMLANLYDLKDAAKEQIHKDYGPIVEQETAKKNDITWANTQVEICLAAGILTEAELKNIRLSAELQKQDLALYMVRTIQKTADAEKLADAKLDKFADADKIAAKCRGSVALLTEMEVVGGDDNGKFQPESFVTRAVFATMLCNILDKYIDKENVKLKIDKYLGLDTAEGYLSSVSDSAVIIRTEGGVYRSYPKDAAMKSTVNGVSKTLTSSYAGDPVKLQIEEGKVLTAAVTEETDITYKQGCLDTIATNTVSVKITDLYTKTSAAYSLASAAVRQNGKEASFTDLSKGAFLTLKLEKGTVKEAVSDTKEYTINGKVGTIAYDTIVTMTVKEDGEADAVLYMDLSDMPSIKRGAMTITIDRLTEGEDIKVTVKGGEVTRIETRGKDASMEGQLTIITRTISNTTWTIKGADGSSATYVLDPAAAAFNGELAIKTDAINPGDEISVVVTAGVISEVHLKKTATPSSDKLSAEILAIDPNNRVLTVLKDNKLIYINCKKAASILNSETGKTISFSALAAGDMIVAYGSYTDSANFDATSIVIELKH